MYLNADPGVSRGLLQRVKPAGFKGLILTIDAIGQGSSDAYVRLRTVSALAPLSQLHHRQHESVRDRSVVEAA
jgi:hypothetical protein